MVIPWQNGSQQLAAEWRGRLVELEAEIRARPDDRWLWILQVRVRILKYLVSRYGDTDIAPPARPREPEHTVAAPADLSMGTGHRLVRSDVDRRAYLASVRPQIRQHLESLEESNTKRYAKLPGGAPLPLLATNVNASSIVELMFFVLLATLAIPTVLAFMCLLAWFLVTLI